MKTTIFKTLIFTALISAFFLTACDPNWNKKPPVTVPPENKDPVLITPEEDIYILSSLQTGFLTNVTENAPVLFVNNNIIMLSLGEGFTITKDDGKTWYTDKSELYYSGATISNGIIYASTKSGAKSSTDYGLTWQNLANPGINSDIEAITNVSGKYNYIIYLGYGENGQFFIISKDYGKNWERYTPTLEKGNNPFDFITGTRYFYNNYGYIEFIDMQSNNKNPVKVLPDLFCQSFSGRNNELFAYGINNINNSTELYYSNDTGDTWTQIKDITGLDISSMQGFAYHKGKLYCSSYKEKGLFVSSNLGKTWELLPNTSDKDIPYLKTIYRNILICSQQGSAPYLYRIE